MSEDIVQRLRKRVAVAFRRLPPRLYDTELHRDSINEIERLRAELAKGERR